MTLLPSGGGRAPQRTHQSELESPPGHRVAIKWLNPHEVLADKASALYADYAQGQFSLLVPAFWDYEVVHGVNKAVARGDLTEQEGHDAIALLFCTGAQCAPPWGTSCTHYGLGLTSRGAVAVRCATQARIDLL